MQHFVLRRSIRHSLRRLKQESFCLRVRPDAGVHTKGWV